MPASKQKGDSPLLFSYTGQGDSPSDQFAALQAGGSVLPLETVPMPDSISSPSSPDKPISTSDNAHIIRLLRQLLDEARGESDRLAYQQIRITSFSLAAGQQDVVIANADNTRHSIYIHVGGVNTGVTMGTSTGVVAKPQFQFDDSHSMSFSVHRDGLLAMSALYASSGGASQIVVTEVLNRDYLDLSLRG